MVHAIRHITRGDVQTLSQVMARAFSNDPVMRWVLGDRWGHDARRYFRVLLNQFRVNGYGLTTTGLEGAALWLAPGTPQGGVLGRIVTHARMVWLFREGFKRSLQIEERMRPLQPQVPHWYLSMLGTDPPRQGKGVASALIEPVLRQCDVDCLPAYLESSSGDNIGFYENHGFRVVSEVVIPGGPAMWPMLREPDANVP